MSGHKMDPTPPSKHDIHHLLQEKLNPSVQPSTNRIPRTRVFALVMIDSLQQPTAEQKSPTSSSWFGNFATIATTLAPQEGANNGNDKCSALCLSRSLADFYPEDMKDQDKGKEEMQGTIHYVHYFPQQLLLKIQQSVGIQELQTIDMQWQPPNQGNHDPQYTLRLEFGKDEDKGPGVQSFEWKIFSSDEAFKNEFVWCLCALAFSCKRMLPNLLHDSYFIEWVANNRDILQKYDVELDEQALFEATSGLAIPDPLELRDSRVDKTPIVSSPTKYSGVLSAVENEHAATVLGEYNWAEVPVEEVQIDLERKLAALETENTDFLLLFGASFPSVGLVKHANGLSTVLDSIDRFRNRIVELQQWSSSCHDQLNSAHTRMCQIEQLKDRLEAQTVNSEALRCCLQDMLLSIEVSPQHLQLLLKPDKLSKELLEAIQSLKAAIRATEEFPAVEMAAIVGRRRELENISRELCQKLARDFKQIVSTAKDKWMQANREMEKNMATVDEASIVCPDAESPGADSSFTEKLRSVRQLSLRSLRTISSRSGEINTEAKSIGSHRGSSAQMGSSNLELELAFDNQVYHQHFWDKHQNIAINGIWSLNVRVWQQVLQEYATSVAPIYIGHIKNVFQLLKDRVERKKLSAKLSNLPLWDPSTPASDYMNLNSSAALLEQGLQHVVTLCVKEQAFLEKLFFHETMKFRSQNRASFYSLRGEPPELVELMEKLFLKFLKRLVDFSAYSLGFDPIQSIPMLSLMSKYLEKTQDESEHVCNVLMAFQIHIKRFFCKFVDDQEAWLYSNYLETRRVGVLSPLKKLMSLLERLAIEESDDNTNETIVNAIHRLLSCAITWIERTAQSKPKYQDIVCLENFYFLYQSLSQFKGIPVFRKYADQTYASYQTYLRRYAADMFLYCVDKLAETITKLHSLVHDQHVEFNELQFHVSKEEIDSLNNTTESSIIKRLQASYERMVKHLCSELNLLPNAWKEFSESMLKQYCEYEVMVYESYNIVLKPTSEQLKVNLREYQQKTETES